MDNKQIKELMTAMERSGIKKLSLKEKSGFELQLERQEESSGHRAEASPPQAQSQFLPHHPIGTYPFLPEYNAHPPVHRAPSPVAASGSAPEAQGGSAQGTFVRSPMVGTFYVAPAPEDPPYVKVGDRVEADTVICIIEAMKVMNEVKAGVSGTVAESLVRSGQPVEFGTQLFRIV